MAYYPIIRKKDRPAAATGHRRLPTFYMEDFSVIGFRVDDCDRALRILARHAYGLRRVDGCSEVAVESLSRVQAVMHLLNENGLGCEIADVADGMYQG